MGYTHLLVSVAVSPESHQLAARAVSIARPNNARISLFLDKKFLPKPTAENQWYQPTQDTENALIHQQNINFVADRDYQSATVQGNGALALNRQWTFTIPAPELFTL